MRLFFAAIVWSVCFVHLAQADIAAQLEGYWTFENTPADTSGAARDFTASNASYVPGLIGQSLSLTGSTASYAIRPVNDTVFDFGAADFTIQVWINYNTTANEQLLIEKWSGTSGPGWTFTKLSSNAFRFHLTTSVFLDTPIQTISTGTWHQLLARRNETMLDIWFDGAPVNNLDVGNTAVVPSGNPLLLGKRNDGDGRGFAANAKFDEVAIWSRALTNAEIDALWNNGNGMPIPEPATLSLLALAGVALLRRRP